MDPVYVQAISHIIKFSIARYISDEHIKNSILEVLNSKKETDDLINKLVTDSENKEANKEALLEAQNKLKTLVLVMPTTNSILSHIDNLENQVCWNMFYIK